MNVFIVEDDVFQLEDVLITLEELGHESVGHTDDPFEALELISSKTIDVALLDLHLNGKLAGIKLAKRIKELYQIPIIFTTSNVDDQVIQEAVDCGPVAYITKPVSKNDLKVALALASRVIQNEDVITKDKEALFIKSGNKLKKVAIRDICYAFTDTKNYCTIVDVQGKRFSLRSSMTNLLQLLSTDNFVQSHRAYLVNTNFIDAINEGDQSIEIQNESIPIGRSFKKEVYQRLDIN